MNHVDPLQDPVNVLWRALLARIREDSDDLATRLEEQATMRREPESRELVFALQRTDHLWLQRNPLMESLMRRAAEEVTGWEHASLEMLPADWRPLSPSAYELMLDVGVFQDDAVEPSGDEGEPGDEEGEPEPEVTTPFDLIKFVADDGSERWSSRELTKVLGYQSHRKFQDVLKKAEEACKSAEEDTIHHFAHVGEMVEIGSGAIRQVDAIHLTRFACYLVAMNGDSRKKVIGQAQAYFAIQTRRQEIADQLREDLMRVQLRGEIAAHNSALFSAARDAGVITSRDFAVFNDAGYVGLYGGRQESDIHAHKKLAGSEKILDRMGSSELAANFFRVTQTADKLKADFVKTRDGANRTHQEVGRRVREAIRDIGGKMPEELETPDHIREAKKRLKQQSPDEVARAKRDLLS